MQSCAEHVTYQLPNEFSRVGYLLDAIQCNDAELQAGIANVKKDTALTGMRSSFESAASYLLPCDPVARKRRAQKQSGGISVAGTEGHEKRVAFGAKQGIGKTGVHLRYHDSDEYEKLTSEQKKELREWRATAGKRKPASQKTQERSQKRQKQSEKAIAAAVEKQLAERLKSIQEAEDSEEKTKAYIMSIVKEMTSSKDKVTAAATATTSATAAGPPVNLKTIICKARNLSLDKK